MPFNICLPYNTNNQYFDPVVT